MAREEHERIESTPGNKILLYLPGQSKAREIGWIQQDTFHCRRDSRKHIHAGGRSVGFNYLLMRTGAFRFVSVHVLPAGPDLHTTRQHVLTNGKFFHFKRTGFERQLFLDLHEFGLDKAFETERTLKAEAEAKQQTREPGLFDEAHSQESKAS
jgi:hypothetical protein